ncbi:dipeptidase [Sediminibacterium soli]|uniref:dipeptidase n=1 Tax=Sediminibacterium soli TaxID=2698829 RepID=UPI0013795869|nr:membrane dipeptidase [Sediminibacterium soli]NCI47304.1 peptidase M19 [Sediminibacterium soli]
MFLIDAHLDLAMNAMEWNRDLRLPVSVLRERETGMTDKPDRMKGTVSLPALRKGNIGLVVATQIARVVQPGSALPGWLSPQQAWAQTQAQLSWYREMEACGEMAQVTDLPSLESHLASWNGGGNETQPVGYILSLEGADSLVTLDHLHIAHGNGLRAIGPAHYGPGRYANGTDATGGLNAEGKALLREMQQLDIILDATHLCDDAFWDAMEVFDGTIWASHNNCRALVNHNRQFSDDMIRALIEKKAVIGGALDAWMMVPGWQRGISDPREMQCSLEKMVDHIDHICQIAGNTLHAGIGTDLDGAFGKEQSPYDIDTIDDIAILPELLQRRGYTEQDCRNIASGNWLRVLREAWREDIPD